VNLLIRESLRISLDSLRHKKISSALTVLGIVIGIASIIALVSIGEGLRNSISQQLESFGSDKIIVMQGSGGNIAGAFLGESLKETDVKKIENMNGVRSATGVLFKSLPIKYRKEIKTTFVIGVDESKTEEFFSQTYEINEGRYPNKGEKGVIVLGALASTKLFEKEVKIGDSVYINDEKFKVIGILKSVGNSQDDKQVYISLESLREISGGKDSLSAIFVKVSDVSRVDDIATSIEKKFDREYGKGSFSAMTSEQITESVGSILSVLTFVLAGIASISLVVAGVGIANTMFTSVLERTREIGIMKAIGATNNNILEIFLIESVLIGFIGGCIGCIVGFALSQIINIIATASLPIKFATVVTTDMILLGIGFSIAVGIVSGLYPARKAAKLQPVEALRYE
jgi:putative ABC transport system permease protein